MNGQYRIDDVVNSDRNLVTQIRCLFDTHTIFNFSRNFFGFHKPERNCQKSLSRNDTSIPLAIYTDNNERFWLVVLKVRNLLISRTHVHYAKSENKDNKTITSTCVGRRPARWVTVKKHHPLQYICMYVGHATRIIPFTIQLPIVFRQCVVNVLRISRTFVMTWNGRSTVNHKKWRTSHSETKSFSPLFVRLCVME